jgi:hypothetical protein
MSDGEELTIARGAEGKPAVFDTALGAERHQLLTRRLYQLYGALELARLLEYGRLARRIETQVDACRRNIEAD